MGNLARFLLTNWLPAPAPQTAVQRQWAEQPLSRRVRAVLLASLALACLFTAMLPFRSALPLSWLSEANASIVRNFVFQIPIAVVVVLSCRQLVKTPADVALRWRGALTSLVLTVPMVLLVFAEHQAGAGSAPQAVEPPVNVAPERSPG